MALSGHSQKFGAVEFSERIGCVIRFRNIRQFMDILLVWMANNGLLDANRGKIITEKASLGRGTVDKDCR